MQAALVKVDVAAARLRWNVGRLFDLTDGGTLLENGFAWVFNLANDPCGQKRDLRWWMPEIEARAGSTGSTKFNYYQPGWVIGRILPEKRVNFHAGEVDQLFQIRPRTRIDLHAEIFGGVAVTKGRGPNFYSREFLAAFLLRRWLGAVSARTNHFSPRAGATTPAYTNKQTTHAANLALP